MVGLGLVMWVFLICFIVLSAAIGERPSIDYKHDCM